MKRFTVLAVLLISLCTYSQEKISKINSDTLFIEAVSFAEKGDLDKTLQLLGMIPKNDSLYCNSLVSRSYYLLEDKKFEDALTITNEGLECDCDEDNSYYYTNKSVAYLNIEDYEKAVLTADEGLETHPLNYKLWSFKGLAFARSEKLREATEAFQKAIIMNPFEPNFHRELGNLLYKQEKTAQALMCFNMFLLLKPDSEDSFEAIKSLNSIAESKNPNKANYEGSLSEDDPTFLEINRILDQKITLREDYKTGNKIDLAIVRQNHALLNLLKDYKGQEGFWDTVYVPFFNWINKEANFDPFIYTLLYSLEGKEYESIIKKNKKEIEAFYIAARQKWEEILSKNAYRLDGIEPEDYIIYTESVVAI